MLSKTELKDWMDDDWTNRKFIRRIGIAQYKLVEIIKDIAELQKFKDELDSLIKSGDRMKSLRMCKDRAWMETLYKAFYQSGFSNYSWKAVRRYQETGEVEPGMQSWRIVLLQVFGNDERWWRKPEEISTFFRNIRLYLRNAIGKKIARDNAVYTVTGRMYGMLEVMSMFDIQWVGSNNHPVHPGVPMFFVERDYAGRFIFMCKTRYFALSITQIQRVKELKVESE